MQTFLPEPSLDSCQHLDHKRLFNQVNEALVIMRAVRQESKAWANHPAVLMWLHDPHRLAIYAMSAIRACEDRGQVIRQHIKDHFRSIHDSTQPGDSAWLGDPDFHRLHRQNLLRKQHKHYSLIFPKDTPDDKYMWPIRLQDGSWLLRYKRVGAQRYESETRMI